ncbi:hypothetical protein HPC49_13305 [Pyxidicoccus fallax]|uniref:Uncharacterized protein n=1 Tax=Pyxidicoccus fallax TaxID=394095 RepID=A0A848LMD8_9BACT|nr:hypothetical protein [Pyxidicoccus fallax]NMO18754.1 hypothetical protein [Pyxidicoccus fallax]NPC79211.1 hypothetical protein [Pyxidicoccus fallax]
MPRYPELFIIDAQLIGASLEEVAARVRQAWEAAGLPPLAAWGMDTRKRQPSPVPPPDAFGPGGLAFEVAGGATGSLVPVGPSGTRFSLRLPVDVQRDPVHLISDTVAAARRWPELLGVGTGIASMSVRRGVGANCLPLPPLVEPDALLVLVRRSRVEEAYTSVEGFLAAWERVHERDGFLLVSRGEAALDTVQWLEVAAPSQWTLARAARPGRTTYRPATPLPEEEPIYLAGTETLRPAGYDDATGVLTFAAWTPPGTHPHGWELYNLLAFRSEGVVPDGRPLRELRVIFPDEAAARREATPFSDIGVRVYFTGPDGEFHSLEER